MRKRNLFAMSLISMALVACSADEDINPANNGNGNEEGGALVSLKLDVAGPQTKATSDNTIEGTGGESTIGSVKVVLKYENGNSVSVTNDAENWQDNTLTFKADVGRLDNIYVYANTADSDTAEGNPTEETTASEDNYYTGNFFMSGSYGTYTIEPGENSVAIDINRIASKVTVESKSEFDGTFGGTMQSMHYHLVNKISKAYLLTGNSTPFTDATYSDAADDDFAEVSLDDSPTSVSEMQNLDAAYCLENISGAERETTTFINFKTVFIPTEVVSIAGGAASGRTPVAEGTDPFDFYVVKEGDEDLKGNYVRATDLGTNVAADGTVTSITGITQVSGLYKDGVCWFGPIWANLSGTTSQMQRNNWYHLTVTNIKLPGSPTEPEEGPGPLVPDVNMNVTVTTVPWYMVYHDIDLQGE